MAAAGRSSSPDEWPPDQWQHGVPEGGTAELVEDDDSTLFVEALTPGSFFAERFRVGEPLGIGAMGKVVQAHDLVTGAEIALKVLHRERTRDAETIERFRREAEILETIGHPGIVRVLAMGTASDQTPWLALELVRGETLKERLRRGPMDPFEIVPVLNTICDALAAAHLRGIVHRDLKPENVLLVTEPGAGPPAKIVDFGLSRFTASKSLTRTGSILGTPRYMAPEQIRSARDADLRVDVFSVGVLLHEMLTTRSPYPAEDLGQLLGCVLAGRTIPLSSVRPDLPPAVGEVIARAMARDREARFQTAGAIAEAYANAIGVRSGRSMLRSMPERAAHHDGAQPLIDPFAVAAPAGNGARPPSERPPALDTEVRPGELARHPLLATVSPGQLGASEVAAAAPPARPQFTRPVPSTPLPASAVSPSAATPSPKRARAPRGARLGWVLFGVALVVVVIVAIVSALALRAWTSGHLPLL